MFLAYGLEKIFIQAFNNCSFVSRYNKFITNNLYASAPSGLNLINNFSPSLVYAAIWVIWLLFCSWYFGKSHVRDYFGITYSRTRFNKSRSKSAKEKAIIAFVLIGILIASIFLAFAINDLFFNSNSLPPVKSSSTSFKLTTPTPTILPTISPSATSNTENQQVLVNYALSLINVDRQTKGLQKVTLSSINSGQQHAEDMLKNGTLRSLGHRWVQTIHEIHFGRRRRCRG